MGFGEMLADERDCLLKKLRKSIEECNFISNDQNISSKKFRNLM